MVGKGNLRQALLVTVAVKRSPTTIPVLHRQQPPESPLHGLLLASLACFFRELNLAECCQHLEGIIGIGIKLVGILKIPTARFALRVFNFPVACRFNLLAEHPLGGFKQRRMIGWQGGFNLRHYHKNRVPDWRKTGSESQGIAFLDFQFLQFADL